jgi:hypothetical protein
MRNQTRPTFDYKSGILFLPFGEIREKVFNKKTYEFDSYVYPDFKEDLILREIVLRQSGYDVKKVKEGEWIVLYTRKR